MVTGSLEIGKSFILSVQLWVLVNNSIATLLV
jgi:hypothetical protein